MDFILNLVVTFMTTSHGMSGYYYVQTTRLIKVYCDMVLNCGGEKGWMKIGDVNPAVGNCPNG